MGPMAAFDEAESSDGPPSRHPGEGRGPIENSNNDVLNAVIET